MDSIELSQYAASALQSPIVVSNLSVPERWAIVDEIAAASSEFDLSEETWELLQAGYQEQHSS